MNNVEKKAYALGIIGREMGVDFDQNMSAEQSAQINAIADDAILDEPQSEIGKKIKNVMAEERANSESEYNKGFNFHKDLNNNKINPSAIFVCELLAKYIERLIHKDETAEGEMLSELVNKLNELECPVDYFSAPFNMITPHLAKLNAAIKGQVEHRQDEIQAYSIGVKHPKFGTLSPHLATLKQMDESIKTLREKFNFTEEDYRGKA